MDKNKNLKGKIEKRQEQNRDTVKYGKSR